MSRLSASRLHEIDIDFVRISHSEPAGPKEVSGYSESKRVVLDGVRFVPNGVPSTTLLMYMHPAGPVRRLPVRLTGVPLRPNGAVAGSPPTPFPTLRRAHARLTTLRSTQ